MSTEQQYHRRKIKESLEIKKTKMKKRRKVLNRNEENHIVFQLRLKTDLTEEAEILESFVID